MKKDVKIMVGCRVEPDLKEILETEATQNTKTLSAYIEGILKQRHFAEENVEKLKERIFELETQNAALQSRFQEVSENENVNDNMADLESKMLAKDVEIRTLKQQKMEVTDLYKRAIQERDVLAKLQGNVIPHWMSEATYKRMINFLKLLKQKQPNFSHEQILVLALATCLKNESGFIVYRIADLLKSKPDFFTTKKTLNP